MKNVNKIIIAILAAGMAFSIAACSGGDSESSSQSSAPTSSASSEASTDVTSADGSAAESQSSTDGSSKSDASNSESAASADEASDTSSKASAEASQSDSKSKDTVVYKGANITIDDDVSKLIKTLGDDYSKQTIEPEEDEENEAYAYTYDNMTVYAYLKDKKEYVASVTVSGEGDAATADGIKIGSSKSDVSKAYGDAGDEDTISYDIDGNILIFLFENDKVSSFFLDRGLAE